MTIATLLMYHQTHLDLFRVLALVLLVFLSLIILLLSFMTLKAIKENKICIED
jgi:tellurite resistance protein TehA-like permease